MSLQEARKRLSVYTADERAFIGQLIDYAATIERHEYICIHADRLRITVDHKMKRRVAKYHIEVQKLAQWLRGERQ